MNTTIINPKRSSQKKVPLVNRDTPFWGDHTIKLHLAGSDFIFSGLTSLQVDKLNQRFGNKTNKDEPAICVIHTTIRYAEIHNQPPEKYAVQNIYTPQCNYFANGLDVEGLGFRANISFEPEISGILKAEDENLLAEPIIFENYLRMLAAYTALYKDGIFLHSAGIIIDEKAYLFIGRSGAGKSTLSRLALEAGYDILSDDANILLPDGEDGYTAEPVPFAGELGAEKNSSGPCYPVGGLYWLEKNVKTEVYSLDPALQSAKVISCCPVVNIDPYRIDRVLKVIFSLLSSARLKVLRFNHKEKFSVIKDLIKE